MSWVYVTIPVLGFIACWLSGRSSIREVGDFAAVLVGYTEIVLLGKAITAEDFPGMLFLAVGLLALVPIIATRPARRGRNPEVAGNATRRVAIGCLAGSAGLFGLLILEVVTGAIIGIGTAMSDPLAFSGATQPRSSSGIENLLFWLARPTFIASGGCAVVSVLAFGLLAGTALSRSRNSAAAAD